ncbi:MAG: hypothetical protein V1865_02790 [bacterium]
MRLKTLNITVLIFVIFILTAKVALAGFGVTPPYVRNEKLSRGAVYEQEINIIRGGDNLPDQMATLEIDAPEVEDWITFSEGNEFLLPEGEKRVRIKARVEVPKRAKIGLYKGTIQLTAQPVGKLKQGSVNIVMGLQLSIYLDVIDLQIIEYKVIGLRVEDAMEQHKWLFFNRPGKIKMYFNINNIGNVEAGPDRITLDVYNNAKSELLASYVDKKIKKIKAFETKEVLAEFKTDLPEGSYRTDFKVYKGDEVINEGEVTFSILSYDRTQAKKKGLPFWAWIIIVLVVIVAFFYVKKRFKHLKRFKWFKKKK